MIGGQKLRQDLGELSLSLAASGEPFHLLGTSPRVIHDDAGWTAYAATQRARLIGRN